MDANSDSSPLADSVAKQPAKQDLALVRTDLANERTLLAYGRTALMVAGTGVSLVEFFDESRLLLFVGWAFVIIGTSVGGIGMARFSRLHRRLHRK